MKAIMYHYVRPAPDRLPYFRYLHVEDFARQLDWLAAHDGFVTREQFVTRARRRARAKWRRPDLRRRAGRSLPTRLSALKERGLFGFFYVCTSPYENGKLLDVHRIHLYSDASAARRPSRACRNISPKTCSAMARAGISRGDLQHQDNDRATTRSSGH